MDDGFDYDYYYYYSHALPIFIYRNVFIESVCHVIQYQVDFNSVKLNLQRAGHLQT